MNLPFAKRRTELLLGAAMAAFALWSLTPPPAGAQAAEVAGPVILTNVQQIVDMGTNAPPPGAEAQFTGIVILPSPLSRRLYVQDGGVGVQVNMIRPVTEYRPGQRVEIRGALVGGLPIPRVVSATGKVISLEKLPEARKSSAGRLAAGKEFYRQVSVRGIVRDMVTERRVLTLKLTEDWRAFEVAVPVSGPQLPREWLDSEIEVEGLAYPFFNQRNQPTGFRFHAASTNAIRVVRPGTGVLWDRPVMSIAEASGQPWDWQRRLRIVGTVTAHEPVDTLFVEDETGPMRVHVMATLPRPEDGEGLEHDVQTWLQPDDRVEVLGVRHTWSSLTPTLIQAEVRRIGKAPPVMPVPVTFADLQAGRYAGRVVSIVARLIDQRMWNTGNNLQHLLIVLQSGEHVFQAVWESEISAAWDLNLSPGGYVRVTGVNEASQGQLKGSPVFQLLLRTPGDLAPAPAPPFWTRPQVWKPVLAASTVAVVAFAWILFQRWQLRRLERRVIERTTSLQAEVEARQRAESDLRTALDAEKELSQLKSSFVSMVSHEFRTPLEVILSSSDILERYFERLAPERRRIQLGAIRKNVRRMNDLIEDVLMLSRFEAGHLSCHPTLTDLGSFCSQVAAEVESAMRTTGRIRVEALTSEEDAMVDQNLLQHILSNLLKNALKYSPEESPVELTVRRHDTNAILIIRDYGRGIPEADRAQLFTAFRRGSNVGLTPGTGLGLVIVQRCMDAHGGTLRFESAESSGTTFFLTLPVFGDSANARREPVSSGRSEGPREPASSTNPSAHSDVPP